jgi:enediyne polyketide synthase
MSPAERAVPIAVVGMACRYPDAADPAQLWEVVLDGRRTFRRLPKERLDLDDYWDRDPAAPDRTYSAYAALLDGWEFDRARFRVPASAYRSADPAHWLALETAGRALDDAGWPEVARDRVGVIVGNSLTGEVTRARTMRLRWPYVQRVLAAAMADAGVPDQQLRVVLDRAARQYLAPFPEVDDETLAGSLSNTIAGRICNHFDFGGGGYTVDGACASSLLAVITACRGLRDGSIDVALAGGVDISLDPFELVGFAKAGALAAGRMRIYDEHSAGFWPGEGCGMLALMRSADAHAAGLPVRAEIVGWGVSSDGNGGITRPERAGQLLALRRAYASGELDPLDVLLHEGHGTGTAVGDETELAALAELRRGARRAAVLGSVKANIGHTKAAAGAAALIKTVCSLESGVLPPTTGCDNPHPALRAASDVLDVPADSQPWPDGPRLAGVSAMGFGGINTHVVLRAAAGARSDAISQRVSPPRVEVIALGAQDVAQLRATLDRLAELAPRLSEAELHDLACQFGGTTAAPVRVGLVAGSPDELAARARLAIGLLDDFPHGRLVAGDGVYAGVGVRGRVGLLFPGQGAPVRSATAAEGTADAQPTIHSGSIAALRWLERLGVAAVAAVGHSLGEFAALVWAGCLSGSDAEWLVRKRGALMQRDGVAGTGMLSVAVDAQQARTFCAGTQLVVAAFNGPRSHVLAGALPELRTVAERVRAAGEHATLLPVSHAFHSPAVADCAQEFRTHLHEARFSPPQRRIVSTVTGRALSPADDLIELLSRQITEPVRFCDAVGEIVEDVDLLCEAGPGRTLGALIAGQCDVPAVGADTAGTARAQAEAAAALFAAQAVPDLAPLFQGRSRRAVDVWRDPVFLTNPCSTTTEVEHLPPEVSEVDAQGVPGVVRELIAQATELEPELITPDLRLLGDLHLTSLRIVQLVANAAEAAGRERQAAPPRVADATVADLIEAVEALPPAGTGEDAPSGVAAWVRCFTETLRPAEPALTRESSGDRLPHIVGGHALSGIAGDVFGAAGWPLLYVPDPAAPEIAETLLAAGRAASEAGGLVVVAHDAALRGFLRSLHHEHPRLGITLLRVPSTVDGLRAASRNATVEPGAWREHVLAEGGTSEPVERPVQLDAGGGLPVGSADVVLVTGGKGIGYECAAALARACGVRLALLGRSNPATDELLRDNLRRLAEDGITAAYQRADATNPAELADAVRRMEERLGPITGVLHASGVNEPVRFEELDQDRLRAHLAPKVDALRHLLAAVSPDRLRLLVTFGSVIGTWGLPGESHYALANGVLRTEAQRLSALLPGCAVLNVDWSVWAGVGMGERLGVLETLARLDVTAIPVAEGTDMFLKLLATPGLPASVAVHGRLGGLDRSGEVDAGRRFLERIQVYQPEVELVAEARLDLGRDKYLSGHRLDDVVVLPAVLGLEAMAQAAARLTGRPMREAVDAAFERPIVVPDGGVRTVRVCALHRGDVIETVLRSEETDFRVDHFRARFPLGDGRRVPAFESIVDGVPLDGEMLYGPIYFHSGPFRRVREFVAQGARRCQARVQAKDDDAWFDDEPLLGSPAANDATVHALQACIPHRRLLPVRCERVSFAPGADAELHMRAVERHAAGDEYVWDVVAQDSDGNPAVVWHGLTLTDTGALPHTEPWPLPLLAAYLERAVTTLGLAHWPQVSVSTEHHVGNPVPPHCRGNTTGVVFTVDGMVCDAQAVTARNRDEWHQVLGSLTTVADDLQARCPEPLDLRATRLLTAAQCLSKAGLGPTEPLLLHGVYDSGWVLLRSGAALIASTVLPLRGVETPVAIAIMSPSTRETA